MTIGDFYHHIAIYIRILCTAIDCFLIIYTTAIKFCFTISIGILACRIGLVNSQCTYSSILNICSH